MSLSAVIDDALTHLADAGVDAGDAMPTNAADLPVAVVSIEHAERPQIGIGSTPDGSQRGALPLDNVIDLAAPVLVSGGESIVLVDAPRTTLIVPNGPLVTSDGSDGPPFAPGDVSVSGPGAAWQITNGPPTGREFRVNPDLGTIEFGEPLEASGMLTVSSHIGVWDITTIRYRGTLLVDVVSTDVDAPAIARTVANTLDRLPAGFKSLTPVGWGSAGPTGVGNAIRQTRRLTFDFVYERIEPIVPTSGGVIRSVAVDTDTDGVVEPFTIPIHA